MEAAHLSKQLQNLLWTEAVQCANVIYNIIVNSDNKTTPFKRFMGQKPKIYNICTKNLEGPVHKKFWEHIQLRTLGAWVNYDTLTASAPWREDVKKPDWDASLSVLSSEAHQMVDLDEDADDEIFQKRMKISW